MKKIIILITIFLLSINISYTQFGKLDPSFGNNGIIKANLGATYEYGFGFKEVLLQPDGSMYVIFERGGEVLFTKRFQNGSRDTSFGQNGFSAAVDMKWMKSMLQSDGKIVIAGSTTFSTGRDFAIARFNTDGSLDKSFSRDGKQTTHFDADAYTTAAAIQNDGKIVVAFLKKTMNKRRHVTF